MITIHQDKGSIERSQMQQVKQTASIRFLPALIKTHPKEILAQTQNQTTPPQGDSPKRQQANEQDYQHPITSSANHVCTSTPAFHPKRRPRKVCIQWQLGILPNL
jgi:hypothetical protein